jgi:nickel/cobalt exporter|tara:strand:+ start:185 stop:1117 length:933 start_codon:yes stop_codon:yes gene_type:complete
MKRITYIFLSFTIITLALLLLINWSEIILSIASTQSEFHKLLSNHIGKFNKNPTSSGLILIAISFCYGVFHAAGPGHGKAVLITYLSTQKESLNKSIFISFSAAIFQSIVAIIIVTIISIILNNTFSKTHIVSLRVEQISYFMVMLFGMYISIQSMVRFKQLITSKFSVNSSQVVKQHGHEHDNCCHHSYAPVKKISSWQAVCVVISMGLRPCTGAIMILIYSKIIGIYWVGISATLLMGFGTGLTVATLGALTVFFREKLSYLASTHPAEHYSNSIRLILSFLGGAILILLGVSLIQASNLAVMEHPLF